MRKLYWAKQACFVFVLCAAAAVALRAQTLTTIYTFNSENGVGFFPQAGLIQGTDGNLYGTVLDYGPNGGGTAFTITTSGTLTVLYSFCAQVVNDICLDGVRPLSDLIQGADGNFYGTTIYGGSQDGNSGTVFKLTPGGALTTLHAFCAEGAPCTDGSDAVGAVIQHTNGNLYGTTFSGGANNIGTVYEVTTSGTLTTLHSFAGPEGAYPYAGLVEAGDGNLYGTTEGDDGVHTLGTVFKITPNGVVTTIHTFCLTYGCPDGAQPMAPVIQGADGNFYGTTYYGGTYDHGAVFKLTSGGTLTTLHSFCAQLAGSQCTDGADPYSPLVQGSDGNFYGTTLYGGPNNNPNQTCSPYGCGTIFKITPSGMLTTVYAFCEVSQQGQYCPDGDEPYDGLVQDTNGTFYGTTYQGGNPYNAGTIFSLSVGLGPFVKTQPSSGKVGSTVNILGTDLTGATSVTINGIAATFTVVSSTEIIATIPFGATSGTIEVTTPGGTLSGTVVFQQTSPFADNPNLTTDFFGDGKGDVGIWRPSNGTWYILSNDGGPNLTQTWGLPGDVPVPGDYYGVGKDAFATWRPSNGTWYILANNGGPNTTEAFGLPDDVPVPADYDGDGKTDVAVWRPSNSTFYVILSSTGQTVTKQWGLPGDVPVTGDYDGDGISDYAIFRPSNGTWYIIYSSTGQTVTTTFGLPGDIPVEGDYENDGKTDLAVWRASNATFYVLQGSTGKTVSLQWGALGDIPVIGDYNGDGINDYAVFRPSNGTWYIDYSGGGGATTQWGLTGDIPASHLASIFRRDKHIANYDGDRKTDIGIWRPSNGTYYVIDSSTGKSVTEQWGENGDLIVPGDYDGDGKTDYAIWRPSNQTWYVSYSSTGKEVTQVLGASGDIPVPGDYDGDGKTDYAVWQPSDGTYTVILSSTGQTVTEQWGVSTDIPVPGDYDGDGRTDYAIWRPSDATFYVILSSTGKTVSQRWGVSTDTPVPGDYDGDTRTDFTIFRPSTGTWYTLQSSNGETVTTVFGLDGDIPVAKDYDGDEKTDIAVFRPSNGTWYILQSSNGQTTSTVWGLSTDMPVNRPTGQ
jgi:uncharacterized repeat protein (TIGR03803 family)